MQFFVRFIVIASACGLVSFGAGCADAKLAATTADGVVQEHSFVAALGFSNTGAADANKMQFTGVTLNTGTTVTNGTVVGGPQSLTKGAVAIAYASFPKSAITYGQPYSLTFTGNYAAGILTHSLTLQSPVRIAPAAPGSAPSVPGSAPANRVPAGMRYPHQSSTFNPSVNEDPAWLVPIGPRHSWQQTMKATTFHQPQRPGVDPPPFEAFTNVPLGMSGNVINEPSGATNNANVAQSVTLETFNTSAAMSLNSGGAWMPLDPTTIFPKADGGFCCDQVVLFIPKIDRFVWVMQSCPVAGCIASGGKPDGPDTERLAAASPETLAASGGRAGWTFWDITPSNLGLQSSDLLDAPDLAIGNNFLYVSFDDVSSSFGTGMMVLRIPLSEIASGSNITWQATKPQDAQQARLCHLTQTPGDSAFWAGMNSDSSIRVFSMPETSSKYSWHDVSIGTWPNDPGNLTAFTPDGVNWLSKPQSGQDFQVLGSLRLMQSGSDHVLFAWNAARGDGFTQPHVQWVTLDAATLNLVSQQQLASPTDAIAFPALASNNVGEVGVSAEFGSGGDFENHGVGFLDDLMLNQTTTSNTGTPRFGDYVTIHNDPTNLARFDAFGYGVNGGAPDTRFVVFGRGTAPPASFNRITIDLTTGNDNAEDSSEITAHVAGQTGSICLKPSNSLAPDGICPNGGSGTTWDNFTDHTTLALPLTNPVPAGAAFTSMTITLRQSGIGPICASCDNWDVQGITVTVSDSTKAIAPATLLSTMMMPKSGDDCFARLRALPNATTARFMLDGSAGHTYADGASSGVITTCTNNGS